MSTQDSEGGHLNDNTSFGQDVLRVAFIAAAYFAAHFTAFLFPDAEKILVAIWPAAGIGLAALLLSPRRLWPVILAAFLMTGILADLFYGRPLFNSVGFTIANVLESLACAWLIIRWCGLGISFNRVNEVAALICAATFVNAGTAFIGAGTAALASASPFWDFWQTWWIGDALGILIVTPLIVTWSTFRFASPRAGSARVLEFGLFLALWCAASWLAFQVHTTSGPLTPQPYILVAFLAYAALRFGQRGVTIALVLLAAIMFTSDAVTVGPFPWGGENQADRLLIAQMFLAGSAVTGLLLAASYAQTRYAEISSREDQARIRAIGDNLPNGIVYQVLRDHNGSMRFLYVSAGVERLSGISAQAVLRDSSALYGQIVADDRQEVAAAEEASARDMSPFNVVARMRRPDGQIRWIQLSSSPHRLADGRTIWDGIQLDITERKRADEELTRYRDHLEDLVKVRTAELELAKKQAEEANRAKSLFLANMSHELRTPMNAILGFSNLMQSDPDVTETQRENLGIINRSGEHLLTLINDVLDMARIEAGRIVVTNNPFDLWAFVRDVSELIQVRADQKEIELAVAQSTDFPRFVNADSAKLRQVLINLVGNAIKYTNQGRVTLRLGTLPAADREHLRLILEIADTGIGIASEDQARIFEPFAQVGAASTQKGTGLGLTISRQYIELMGGNISVQSTFGKGSTFRVEVPVELATEAEVVKIEVENRQVLGLEPGQPVYRVLIVEDQIDNQLLLKKLLERAGFQVRLANNGEEGVELFKTWHPHFIWMDRRMPIMDGLEATRRIRNLEGGKDVKIAAMTASVFEEQREEMLRSGLDDFVRKPFRPTDIFNCMARQLGVRYIYEETTLTEETAPPLTPEALAALPEDVRKELTAALIRLDIERINEVIRQISVLDSRLGRALARRASSYDFTAILQALQTNSEQEP